MATSNEARADIDDNKKKEIMSEYGWLLTQATRDELVQDYLWSCDHGSCNILRFWKIRYKSIPQEFRRWDRLETLLLKLGVVDVIALSWTWKIRRSRAYLYRSLWTWLDALLEEYVTPYEKILHVECRKNRQDDEELQEWIRKENPYDLPAKL